MEIINRLDLVFGVTSKVALFDSELIRWLNENGHSADDLIKVKADVPKDRNVDLEEERVSGDLTHYAINGMPVFGKVYKCVMAAAGEARKATTTWISSALIPELSKWMLCGLNAKTIKFAVNKFMAYLGLLASASKRFEDAFGRRIDIRRIAIVKDFEITVEGVTSMIAKERNISEAEARKLVINAFDGMGIINADLTKGESCTIRGPWIKAFVQAVNWKTMKEWLKENGISTKLIDFWGNEIDLDDVDIILTESCFKAVKNYESWEQYCNAFEMLHHSICVCVREHQPKLKGMPYQQGQTLLGNEADADLAAMHAKDTVRKYSNPDEAINLLPKWQRKAAKKYKGLIAERHTARTIQEKYMSKRDDMRGGRIPELGYNAFAAADIIALIQWIFGAPVTGFLKAGECFCSNCKPGEVDITRNPHMDNAHVILNCVPKMPLAIGPTMFVNIFDLTTIKLRCDYDGDHFWYSQNKWLLDLVRRTYDVLSNVTFDWEVPASKKIVVTKKDIVDFVANLMHGSEIGLYADALTKMWNHAYNRDICGWLTYGANVIIDSAKHGEVDKEVLDTLKGILKEMSKLQLPEYCRFAKADKEHPANSKYWLEERYVCRKPGSKTAKIAYESEYKEKVHGEIEAVKPARTAYTGSFLDMYSSKVEKYIPAVLEINDTEDLIFDSHVMLIKPDRKYGRLSNLSRKARECDENGNYVDGGVFQKIAFRHATEWKELCGQESFKMNHEEWEEMKQQEALKEMLEWAREQYADYPQIDSVSDNQLLDAIYDIVTRNVFSTTKTSDGYDMAVKNAYWRIFGEKANEVIAMNLGLNNDDDDISDFDDDDELFNP